MAAPYVTGVASLVQSQNPTFTPAQIKQRLVETADDLQYGADGIGYDEHFGWGEINAFKALTGQTYLSTWLHSAPIVNNVQAGDVFRFYDFYSYVYYGSLTISSDMITNSGRFMWNGLLNSGRFGIDLLPYRFFFTINNDEGGYTIIESDRVSPNISSYSVVNSQHIKISFTESSLLSWVSAYVFDQNGNYLFTDFEDVKSEAGNNLTLL